MTRVIRLPGYRLSKDGSLKKISKDAAQKQRWKGSKRVRVKRKGAA